MSSQVGGRGGEEGKGRGGEGGEGRGGREEKGRRERDGTCLQNIHSH